MTLFVEGREVAFCYGVRDRVFKEWGGGEHGMPKVDDVGIRSYGYCTPKTRTLLLHTLPQFIHWPDIVLYFVPLYSKSIYIEICLAFNY